MIGALQIQLRCHAQLQWGHSCLSPLWARQNCLHSQEGRDLQRHFHRRAQTEPLNRGCLLLPASKPFAKPTCRKINQNELQIIASSASPEAKFNSWRQYMRPAAFLHLCTVRKHCHEALPCLAAAGPSRDCLRVAPYTLPRLHQWHACGHAAQSRHRIPIWPLPEVHTILHRLPGKHSDKNGVSITEIHPWHRPLTNTSSLQYHRAGLRLCEDICLPECCYKRQRWLCSDGSCYPAGGGQWAGSVKATALWGNSCCDAAVLQSVGHHSSVQDLSLEWWDWLVIPFLPMSISLSKASCLVCKQSSFRDVKLRSRSSLFWILWSSWDNLSVG